MTDTSAVAVTAAIIEKHGQVLIVRKGAGKRHAGRWEFPGGKVESGERPEECLEREILEELGIRVRVGDFVCESIYAYPHATIRLLAFRVDRVSGSIRLNDHDAMAWVSPSALPAWNLLPADIPVAEALGAIYPPLGAPVVPPMDYRGKLPIPNSSDRLQGAPEPPRSIAARIHGFRSSNFQHLKDKGLIVLAVAKKIFNPRFS